jgi:hypothetical protein
MCSLLAQVVEEALALVRSLITFSIVAAAAAAQAA